MLYDLTFLDKKQSWPVPSEQRRMRRYAANESLYQNEHDKVFGNWWRLLREDKKASLEIMLNFPRRLTNLWGDLLVGEQPVYSRPEEQERAREGRQQRLRPALPSNGRGSSGSALAPSDSSGGGSGQRLGVSADRASGANGHRGDPPAQGSAGVDPLQEFVERARFNSVTREVVTDMSRFGEGLYRVRRKGGRAHIEATSPQLWYPVVKRGDVRDIQAHVLAWKFTVKEPKWLQGEKEQDYIFAEIHTPGYIEHRLLYLKGQEIGDLVPDERARELFPDWRSGQQSTGYSGMLVFHVPNMRASNRLHGYDDYKDVEGPLQELEVRLAQASRILDKHADPNMAGPRPTITTSLQGPMVETGGRYFIVNEGEAFPQFLAWDGQLEASFKEMEWLEEKIYTLSETSPTGFGISKTGYAESGTSLKIRMRSELSKAARLRTELDPVAKEVLDCATHIDTEMERVRPAIEWKEGLPDDPKEQAEIESSRKSAGLTSVKASLMRLDGYTEDRAEEELADLLDDPERLEQLVTLFKALGADLAPLKARAALLAGIEPDQMRDAPPGEDQGVVDKVGAIVARVSGQNGAGNGQQPPGQASPQGGPQ